MEMAILKEETPKRFLFQFRGCVGPGHNGADKDESLSLFAVFEIGSFERLHHVVDFAWICIHDIINNNVAVQNERSELFRALRLVSEACCLLLRSS